MQARSMGSATVPGWKGEVRGNGSFGDLDLPCPTGERLIVQHSQTPLIVQPAREPQLALWLFFLVSGRPPKKQLQAGIGSYQARHYSESSLSKESVRTCAFIL